MQSAGLIPLISPIVQPKADLCPFRTRRSFSSCKEVSVLLIITGFFWSSSRKAYFRGGGSCLSSSIFSVEECSSLSKFSFQIFLRERGGTFSNCATEELKPGTERA